MYPYHNRIKQRIKNGELLRVEPSCNPEFAIILIFSTVPHTRPIRPHAVEKYKDLI